MTRSDAKMAININSVLKHFTRSSLQWQQKPTNSNSSRRPSLVVSEVKKTELPTAKLTDMGHKDAAKWWSDAISCELLSE